MTTTTPHTLSELADIGAKAGMKLDDGPNGGSCAFDKIHDEYKLDQKYREAFAKAILDAIGYKLPVDHEREAFDKWAKETNTPESEFIFAAFKAGRAMLRESMEKQPEKSDIKDYIFHYQSDRDLAKSVPLKVQQPENDGWKDWSGGERPVGPRVSVQVRYRDMIGETGPAGIFDWRHNIKNQPEADIIAYKIVTP